MPCHALPGGEPPSPIAQWAPAQGERGEEVCTAYVVSGRGKVCMYTVPARYLVLFVCRVTLTKWLAITRLRFHRSSASRSQLQSQPLYHCHHPLLTLLPAVVLKHIETTWHILETETHLRRHSRSTTYTYDVTPTKQTTSEQLVVEINTSSTSTNNPSS